MLTTSIQQRVQDNINRTDAGITTKIQGWVNESKRKLEQMVDMDYMRTSAILGSITNAAPSLPLPTLLKHAFLVRYRKLLPNEELGWTDLPRLSEREITEVMGYDAPGIPHVGDPSGYQINGVQPAASLTVYPSPLTTDTWQLWAAYYTLSADWTFGVGEEPYLAMYAYPAIIDWSTALSYRYFGQVGDAEKWEKNFEDPQTKRGSLSDFHRAEMLRALAGSTDSGEITLRPHSGAIERRPSGGVTRPLTGWRV